MRVRLLIWLFSCLLTPSAKANMDCIYTARKNKITVMLTGQCFSEGKQRFVDSFLNAIIAKYPKDINDLKFQTLILINYEVIYHDFGGVNYFISLGLDTLRLIDSHFIGMYGQSHFNSSDDSRKKPLDINATNSPSTNEIGIKVIFNRDYRDTVNWDQVERLVLFALENQEDIKSLQTIDTARHYSWYITLPTIDTNLINRIIGISYKPYRYVSTFPANKKNWRDVIVLSMMSALCCITISRRVGAKHCG